jgi:hypothetical protein
VILLAAHVAGFRVVTVDTSSYGLIAAQALGLVVTQVVFSLALALSILDGQRVESLLLRAGKASSLLLTLSTAFNFTQNTVNLRIKEALLTLTSTINRLFFPIVIGIASFACSWFLACTTYLVDVTKSTLKLTILIIEIFAYTLCLICARNTIWANACHTL